MRCWVRELVVEGKGKGKRKGKRRGAAGAQLTPAHMPTVGGGDMVAARGRRRRPRSRGEAQQLAGAGFLEGVSDIIAAQEEQEQRTASGRVVRRADQFHDLPPTAQHNRNLARGRTAQEQANWHLF